LSVKSTGAARAAFDLCALVPGANNNHHTYTGGVIVDKEHTLRILNALANGVHPATGEQYAADSPYQHPDTVRALFEAVRVMEQSGAKTAERPARPAAMPGNTGLRWTSEEEERLAAAFDAGKTIDELARGHNRTRAGIEARLVKLGKLDASAVTVQLRYPPKRPAGETQPGA
jgi:hypothetical protein